MTAPRAGAPPVVAAADADLGLGQVLGSIDAGGRVGAIFAGSWHGVPPEKKVLPEDTLSDGKMFIATARFPCYRLHYSRKFVLFVVPLLPHRRSSSGFGQFRWRCR